MKDLNDYIRESILDDEEELIGRAKNAFKNWIAFVSCMYFEKDWDDDKILEYLNSKYVMSFFPSLKGYEWKVFSKSSRMKDTHYILQNGLSSIAVKLELMTNKAELQIGCEYFNGGELAKLKRRIESDCKMKFTHISNNFGQSVIYYVPKNDDYWKDWDSFK